MTETKAKPSNPTNPVVFFDIALAGKILSFGFLEDNGAPRSILCFEFADIPIA